MAIPLFSATPPEDSSLFQEIHEEQSALGKQALEVFRETQKDDEHEDMDEHIHTSSRQLLESLTTKKSFTQLYDEAVNEQEKQKLLTKQIADTIGNPELTFEQKQTTIDQLEQDCGNMMYVIAFNTLVEKHAVSSLFSLENYQQLLDIDQSIQERRDRDIGDLMQTVADLVNQSTTITDPAARRDIITKMSILMILGSGINVRKMYEAELTRLKQEFAALFFEIPPTKNGSGTKKLLRAIKKSYTSVELSAELHHTYPPLAKFVDMIDELLESSKKSKESNTPHAWEKFSYMHNAIFTTHRDKMANAIDNFIQAELAYTGDIEHNQKIGELRNTIQSDPKKLQDYFMLSFIIVDARNDAPEMTDNLSATIGESIKYIIDNTDRQRTLQAVYNFDVTKVCPEVAQILAWNSMTFPFELFLQERGRAWCVENLGRERIYRHIRSVDTFKDHLDLKQLIEKVGLDVLKNHPDGMWILMKCMSQELKGKSFEEVRFDTSGNAYFKEIPRPEGSIGRKEYEHARMNVPFDSDYGKSSHARGLDGGTYIFGNGRERSDKIVGEYYVTRKKDEFGGEKYKKYVIHKNLKSMCIAEIEIAMSSIEMIGDIEDDCVVFKTDTGYEVFDMKQQMMRGKLPPKTEFTVCGIHDGLIQMYNKDAREIFFFDLDGNEQLSFVRKQYKKIGDFHEGLARCTKNETLWSGTYGFIDKTGKEVIPCVYDRVDSFSEGLARVRKDGAHYFINQQNEIALTLDEYFSKIDKNALPEKQEFHLQQAHPFKNGFTRVTYKYKNYPRAWSSNPAGYEEAANKVLTRFYDKTGKLLKFPGSYVIAQATDFCGGIAKVQLQDGSRGLIDTFGNFYPVKG